MTKYINYYWLIVDFLGVKINSRLVYKFDNFDVDNFYEFCKNTAISEVNTKTQFNTYENDRRLGFVTHLIHSQIDETT